MTIKDVNGMYEIKVDPNRGISYEKNIGLWKAEDFKRFHNDYVTKVIPMFMKKKWAKCVDLREYKTSSISDEIVTHNEYCEKNGLDSVAIIVSSAVVKMQMNRVAQENKLAPTAFTDLSEADVWLKSRGF